MAAGGAAPDGAAAVSGLRRMRPCACRVRTLMRISVGVMLGIPLDVVADGVKAGLETGHRAHHRVRQWTQSGQPLAQARDDHVEASQVGLAFAFRALAQELAALLFGAFLLRLDK